MKAFPIDVNTSSINKWQGMDLRDYFAAKAINSFNWNSTDEYKAKQYPINANQCYEIADAMMKAREQ